MLLLSAQKPSTASLIRVDTTVESALRTLLNCEEVEHTALFAGQDVGLSLGVWSDDAALLNERPLNRAATKLVRMLKWATHKVFDPDELDALTVYGDVLVFDEHRDLTDKDYATICALVRERSAQSFSDARAEFDKIAAAESAFWTKIAEYNEGHVAEDGAEEDD